MNQTHEEIHWSMDEIQLGLAFYQMNSYHLSSLHGYIRIVLGLLTRAGFLIIQIGNVPTTSVPGVILQNIIDIGVSSLIFFLIGFPLAFGDSAFGFIGFNKWIWYRTYDEYTEDLILGWVTVIIGSGIITSMTAGRIHPLGYTMIYLVSAGFVQPLVLHWSWHQDGWLRLSSKLSRHLLSFHDQGGGFVCHVYGALWAFIGMLFLGRRLIRLADLDDTSLPPASPALSLLGYVLLVIGFLSVPLPTWRGISNWGFEDALGPVGINGIIAFSAGLVVESICFGFHVKTPLNYWAVLRCLRCGLAAVILLLAGMDKYHPLVALIFTLIASIIFDIICKFHSSIAGEDYCYIFEVHLVPGLIGVILEPLLARGISMLIRWGWQILGTMVLSLFVIVFAVITFIIIKCLGLLRNTSEKKAHSLARKVRRIRTPDKFDRLFPIGPNSVILEPGTQIKHLLSSEEESSSSSDSADIIQHQQRTEFVPMNQNHPMYNDHQIKPEYKYKENVSANSMPDLTNQNESFNSTDEIQILMHLVPSKDKYSDFKRNQPSGELAGSRGNEPRSRHGPWEEGKTRRATEELS